MSQPVPIGVLVRQVAEIQARRFAEAERWRARLLAREVRRRLARRRSNGVETHLG